jgi:hypothetical protein
MSKIRIVVGKNTGTVSSNDESVVTVNGVDILPDDNGEVLVKGDKIIKGRKA